ncbi:MAG: hypothetical protein RR744_00125 [Cellulosilyticaceae bacterium]
MKKEILDLIEARIDEVGVDKFYDDCCIDILGIERDCDFVECRDCWDDTIFRLTEKEFDF